MNTQSPSWLAESICQHLAEELKELGFFLSLRAWKSTQRKLYCTCLLPTHYILLLLLSDMCTSYSYSSRECPQTEESRLQLVWHRSAVGPLTGLLPSESASLLPWREGFRSLWQLAGELLFLLRFSFPPHWVSKGHLFKLHLQCFRPDLSPSSYNHNPSLHCDTCPDNGAAYYQGVESPHSSQGSFWWD